MIQTPPKKLNLKYGHLCLDFTNTVFWRLLEEPIEGFKDYSIFIKWGQKIGILTEADATRLIQGSQKHPDKAALVLSRVIKLREAVYRIILANLRGNQPEIGDTDILNLEISKMFQQAVLIYTGRKFEWGWKAVENDLDQMLWPILSSSTELLTSTEMGRIGICKGDGCGWLFYDSSRNQSRKWCDMGDCGNRAKARRFYKRKKKELKKN